MTQELLIRLCFTTASLMLIGTVLVLPLFKNSFTALFHSAIFIKIIMWIPIFIVFVAFLYSPLWARATLLCALLTTCFVEIGWRYLSKHSYQMTLLVYSVALGVSLCHAILYGTSFTGHDTVWLIGIALGSVLSDVCAYFFGNYLGRHHLPALLNNNKSWEGVAGQLAGAFIGIILVKLLIVDVPLLLFIPIGIGAIMGDLSNSYVKRLMGIKDWSGLLPGHGGYTDRLSSLSGSLMLSYWFIRFFLN